MKTENEIRRRLAVEYARHARAADETAKFALFQADYGNETIERLCAVSNAWADVLSWFCREAGPIPLVFNRPFPAGPKTADANAVFARANAIDAAERLAA